MNNIAKTVSIALAIVLGVPSISLGQEPAKKDSLSSETVIIRREFEPVIKNANKINTQPVIKPVENASTDFKYDMVPQNLEYNFTPDTIKAVRIKGEPLTKLYRAYVKAGMGNYLNNYGELHLHSLRSRDLQWGLDVHHLGSDGGIKNLPYNGMSHQNVDLFGKKMLKHHMVDAGFNFDRQRVYYYGYDPNMSFPEDLKKDSIQQTYITYTGHAGIESFFADSNVLNYKVGVNYHHLAMKSGTTSENNVLITSRFSRFYGTEKGLLYFDIDYNKAYTDSNAAGKTYTGNVLIKPGVDVQFMGDKWKLTAGFRLALENESKMNAYFFPNAEFKYNVVRNLIVPYVGVTGGIKRNSFNTLRQNNPYLYELSDLKNTRTAYDLYIGVRGVVSSSISYNISGGYKQAKDMVLFVSDSIQNSTPVNYYENIYRPVYDTVNMAYISAQVGYQKSDKWNLMWRIKYTNYETTHEVKAWNLPDVTSDLTLRYNLHDKIIAKTSMTFMSGRYMKTTNITDAEQLSFDVYGRKLDPLFDFNIGLEYRFTKKVSAFLDVNNILSQNYQLWGNYQVQGINVLGGITFALWAK